MLTPSESVETGVLSVAFVADRCSSGKGRSIATFFQERCSLTSSVFVGLWGGNKWGTSFVYSVLGFPILPVAIVVSGHANSSV